MSFSMTLFLADLVCAAVLLYVDANVLNSSIGGAAPNAGKRKYTVVRKK